jgi:hypothetical protein
MFLGRLSNYKSYFRLIFLAAGFVGGPAVRHANADVMYTYTGNAFDTFPSGASCPPVCNVTGSFVVADPLAADLPVTVIDPISFNLTSAGVTLTDGEGQRTDSFLGVATDGTGAIIEWSWVEVGPASAPTARILTEEHGPLSSRRLRSPEPQGSSRNQGAKLFNVQPGDMGNRMYLRHR